jgi:hypothetical protein
VVVGLAIGARWREKGLTWYFLISRRATVPGLYLWGFLTPPVVTALEKSREMRFDGQRKAKETS